MNREVAHLSYSGRLGTWEGARRDEALRALEAGTLRELEFDAVVFRSGPNRNHLRIRSADMATFAASFVGVPFLRDHRIESLEARAGIVVKSALEHGIGNRALGRTAGKWIRQTIRLTTQRDIRAFLEGQIDRFSVAWYYDGVRCSVCGREWGECSHKPGRAYRVEQVGQHGESQHGESQHRLTQHGRTRLRCELIFENPRGKEVSAVNAPAVEGTGVLAGGRLPVAEGFSPVRAVSDARCGMPDPGLKPCVGGWKPPPGNAALDQPPGPLPPGPLQFGSSARTGARVDRSFDHRFNKEKGMVEEAQGTLIAGNVTASADGGAHLALLDDPLYGGSAGAGDAEAGQATVADAWLAALRTQVVDGMLARSGLSAGGMAAVRTALAGDALLTPQRVQQVIEAQRSAEASLRGGGMAGGAGVGSGSAYGAGRGVVHGLQPTVQSGITGMRSAEEEVQSALNWLLGDTRSATPSPHLRNLRDIYLAVTGDINFWGVFNPDYARLQSANSGTLAGMAVNALNKAVMLHYDNLLTYRWYEPIVHVLPHDGTTQPLQLIHMDGIAALPAVAEGAAYTESTTGDSKETATFGKYGAYVGITLEMIRRSDIARIQAIPRLLVQAAIRRRSATVAAVFTGNPTLADDSTALFHANHGNADTTAFSAAAWEAARTRIFEQTLPGTGKPLALWPTYCLTPIELYDDALTAFGYGSGDVGKPNGGGTAQEPNVYAQSRPGDPRPIPIVVPEWSDATDWAYIVDPRLHPVLIMAYANATAGGVHALPEIFEVRSESAGLMFSNDTLPVKVRDWWAFGVATHVGVGRNTVAG